MMVNVAIMKQLQLVGVNHAPSGSTLSPPHWMDSNPRSVVQYFCSQMGAVRLKNSTR